MSGIVLTADLLAKAKPHYFMRVAAFLAIAMTLSVLAYRWTGKAPAST